MTLWMSGATGYSGISFLPTHLTHTYICVCKLQFGTWYHFLWLILTRFTNQNMGHTCQTYMTCESLVVLTNLSATPKRQCHDRLQMYMHVIITQLLTMYGKLRFVVWVLKEILSRALKCPDHLCPKLQNYLSLGTENMTCDKHKLKNSVWDTSAREFTIYSKWFGSQRIWAEPIGLCGKNKSPF